MWDLFATVSYVWSVTWSVWATPGLRVVHTLVCLGYSRVMCGAYPGLCELLPGYVWSTPWSVWATPGLCVVHTLVCVSYSRVMCGPHLGLGYCRLCVVHTLVCVGQVSGKKWLCVFHVWICMDCVI